MHTDIHISSEFEPRTPVSDLAKTVYASTARPLWWPLDRKSNAGTVGILSRNHNYWTRSFGSRRYPARPSVIKSFPFTVMSLPVDILNDRWRSLQAREATAQTASRQLCNAFAQLLSAKLAHEDNPNFSWHYTHYKHNPLSHLRAMLETNARISNYLYTKVSQR
jgi:hypothetical protein